MAKRKSSLKRFYCVTESFSLYRVTIMQVRSLVRVAKLHQKGKLFSLISVGEVCDGAFLSVGKRLCLTYSDPNDPSEGLQFIPSATIALFIKKADALECLQKRRLKPCDARWKKKTIQVLQGIGKNHPLCGMPIHESAWLISSKEW